MHTLTLLPERRCSQIEQETWEGYLYLADAISRGAYAVLFVPKPTDGKEQYLPPPERYEEYALADMRKVLRKHLREIHEGNVRMFYTLVEEEVIASLISRLDGQATPLLRSPVQALGLWLATLLPEVRSIAFPSILYREMAFEMSYFARLMQKDPLPAYHLAATAQTIQTLRSLMPPADIKTLK